MEDKKLRELLIEGLSTFIYLWTRDANLPVNEETEEYIFGQLKVILETEVSPVFSDMARIEMSIRIIERVAGINATTEKV